MAQSDGPHPRRLTVSSERDELRHYSRPPGATRLFAGGMYDILERLSGCFAHAGLVGGEKFTELGNDLGIHFAGTAPGGVADVGVSVSNIGEEFIRCGSRIVLL